MCKNGLKLNMMKVTMHELLSGKQHVCQIVLHLDFWLKKFNLYGSLTFKPQLVVYIYLSTNKAYIPLKEG